MNAHLALGSDFGIKRFQSKLADKLSAHSFRNRGCFTENAPVQLLDHSFGIGAVLWKLAKKPLIWLLWDHAVSLELTGIRLFETQAVSFELFENLAFTLEKNI